MHRGRAAAQLHLAAADGEEDGAGAGAHGGVEGRHDTVKRLARAARLAHQLLHAAQLPPQPRRLRKHPLLLYRQHLIASIKQAALTIANN